MKLDDHLQSGSGSTIPISPWVAELPYGDPIKAFAPFADEPFAVLLHSGSAQITPDAPPESRQTNARNRYSSICLDPFRKLHVYDGTLYRDGVKVSHQSQVSPRINATEKPEHQPEQQLDPFTLLSREMAPFKTLQPTAPVPFCGGAVGFLGYELGGWIENLPPALPYDMGVLDMGVPDMAMGLFDVVAVFDHQAKRAWVLSTGFPEKDPARRDQRAQSRGQALHKSISDALHQPMTRLESATNLHWQAEISRETHEQRVQQAIDHITAGDIFQANITQRFHAMTEPNPQPYGLFRRLSQATPAPFSAYMNDGLGGAIASVSPERFLKVSVDGKVETRPIKGTRPRGKTPEADQHYANDLKNSIKDRAENLMIVDLMRNDISRVCALGSVRVPQLCGLESFANVHHLVSVVEGRLATGKTAIDLLRACFPGGSITGAPKVHCMELIHQIEQSRRGPYCGSMIRLGFDGALDSSILIRTLIIGRENARGQRPLTLQAGGGIVHDSVPTDEYDECLTKAGKLLSALQPDWATF